MAILQVTPNVPTEIALRYPEGKPVEGRFGDQVMYSLAKPENTVLYLDMDVAGRLNMLEPRVKETILICKRWSGKKGDRMQWDFWRPAEGETKPNQAGASVSAPAPEPPAQVSPKPAVMDANYHNRPNGANGHQAARAINPALPIPPTKSPMNQAVVEAVRMVQAAMKETGEQWSDQSRQDLVSTVLITAQREGWLTMWERTIAAQERSAA